MVAPQLVILAVILPLESSRILGSVAIDAAGRGRTLLCALALEADFVSGEVRLLAGENGFMLCPFSVGGVGLYLSIRTHTLQGLRGTGNLWGPP